MAFMVDLLHYERTATNSCCMAHISSLHGKQHSPDNEGTLMSGPVSGLLT